MLDPLFEIAARHFDGLAKRFPVMCASDEFHFLPRAVAAGEHFDQLDNLAAGEINACISELKAFQKELDRCLCSEKDLEKSIDLELLKASAAGFLIAMEAHKSWRHNPLLYLKIAFIGIDHALTKPAPELQECNQRTAARLHAVPRLLNQAVENIEDVPETYYRASRAMLKDGKRFLTQIAKDYANTPDRNLSQGFSKAFSALGAFDNFLKALKPVPNRLFAGATFENSLRDHFRSERSLDEVFQIAVEEWHHCLNHLKRLQSQIDSKKTWQELYHQFYPLEIETMDTLSLYRRQAKALQMFFSRHGFSSGDLGAAMEIITTPAYLESVRGSASFGAAFTANASERSFFYITSHRPGQNNSEAEKLLKRRLHREYKFLSAHETIPGHHLLDSVRRRLKNPIRSQIESPLFYEGWATYAETLLRAYGYVNAPIEYLVDYKRRLWRSARCQIDVGFSTGMLSREKAVNLLTKIDFSSEEANQQIDRFQLNPGYQLCYTLGSYEIKNIVDTYGPRLGKTQCRRYVLTGGELPFHLIEKRLAFLQAEKDKALPFKKYDSFV